jgi:hypothetical protein
MHFCGKLDEFLARGLPSSACGDSEPFFNVLTSKHLPTLHKNMVKADQMAVLPSVSP